MRQRLILSLSSTDGGVKLFLIAAISPRCPQVGKTLSYWACAVNTMPLSLCAPWSVSASGFLGVARFEGFAELTDLGLCTGLERSRIGLPP